VKAIQDHQESRLFRSWFRAMVWISVVVVADTFASFAWAKHGLLSHFLFWVGLAGENNLGAWWSGMLLLIGALHAFDGFGNTDNLPSARRGWLVLSAILLALSFDELASLHEFLGRAAGDDRYLLVLAIIGAMLLAYSVSQLAISKLPWRHLGLILLSFALFGSVYLQEVLQSIGTWDNPYIKGLRGMIEEGTEITGMLILIFVTRTNTRVLLNRDHPDALIAATLGRVPLIVAAGVSIPIMTAATFILPFPGGPADWLAACIYLLCAAHVFRPILLSNGVLRQSTAPLLLFYLVASALSNGLHIKWDPEIFGVPVSIRGVGIAGLLLTANIFFRSGGRPTTIWFYPAAAAALLVSLWPNSQILWCMIPTCVALWIFTLESRQHSA